LIGNYEVGEVMKSTTHDVPTFYIMQFSNVLAKQGVCLSESFTELGLDMSDYTSLNVRIPAPVFSKLITHIVTQKNVCSPGMLLGSALQPIHHGSFGLAVMNCNSGMGIIRLVQRFINVLIPYVSLNVIEHGNLITVNVIDRFWKDETHCFFIDVLTAAFINLHNGITQAGNPPIIKGLLFDYSKHTDETSRDITANFDCKFKQPLCGVIVDAENANRPLIGSDPVSYQYAVQLCEADKERILGNSLSHKLKRYLENECHGMPILDDAASAMNMSKRTLHRQLEAEHTSFKKERDTFLMLRAYELLHIKRLSVQQTADILGYADPSNFRRAFIKWFGSTPSSFQ
jgi:AraC-like DNA-binding protein